MWLGKAELVKTLRAFHSFDTNASPFIAVQINADEPPCFYRSSSFGQIQTENFNLSQSGNIYVSLGHFQDCLKALSDEKVELTVAPNGGLRINSVDNSFGTELSVHTVTVQQAGLKVHDVGEIALRLDTTTFLGFDSSPFASAAPPILMQGRLMLPTKYGAVIWNGPDVFKTIQLQPREAFLKLISNNLAVEAIFQTSNGYWGTKINGQILFSRGHMLGKELFDLYNVPGVELTRLPANRLVQAMGSAAALCGDQDKVDFVPKEGITVKDKFGNTSKFSLGGIEGFTRFSTFGRTVKTIADALIQAKDEEAVLLDVTNFSSPTKRLTRGPWEVSFRTV